MSKYKITFADGTTLDNLELSGSYYVTSEKLTADFFTREKLAAITISSEYTQTSEDGQESKQTITQEYEHMKLADFKVGNDFSFDDYKGKYLFALAPEYTPEELYKLRVESRLDYLEMIAE
ncbi:MAG: hypothetical protein IJ597_05220 [Synergistaceae bacterium]|nr:hypothetical protein [Synergistaceae bacterium]